MSSDPFPQLTGTVPTLIVTAPGTHQSAMGGTADWDPSHPGSWLRDHGQDGVYTLTTFDIPPGNYEAKIAHDRSWLENYGSGGTPGGANISFTVPPSSRTTFRYELHTHLLTVRTAPVPTNSDLIVLGAQWLRRDLLVIDPLVLGSRWPVADGAFRLRHAPGGGISLAEGVVSGGTSVPLTVEPDGLPAQLRSCWPHLLHCVVLRLPPEVAGDRALLTEMLCDQLVVTAHDETALAVVATGVQLPGVLDDLFEVTRRELGLHWVGAVPSIAVWAPTAKQVHLRLLLPGSTVDSVIAMTRTDDGVWAIVGESAWEGGSYLFEVKVFVPETGEVRTNLVTDPYSLALTTNSARSVIADLAAPALKPQGWDALGLPALGQPVDSTIYELHVRDFSVGDVSVPVQHRGGYLAFTDLSSAGMRHLARLSAAGLNTVHLLPTFDFSTVEDVRTDWAIPPCDLPALTAIDPAGTPQQACVMGVAARDGFNWGYDPWHYSVPEGSYASDPEGPLRTLEFRRMVAALAGIGLRVVVDVVYNHTVASGQDPRSVLDRVVPGYYHRLTSTGVVENSTCCSNTASEHAMMQRLIVDSVVHWATQYKVGGFRFDLMGHHPKSTMLAVRAALDGLTIDRDGIDGRSVYVYGEGWNFGEVADNSQFVQATQTEMAGTGIGTFNDRLRDAIRGGAPFDADPRGQGFGTGLFTDSNGSMTAGPPVLQRDSLLAAQDQIKIGLTGNLRDFQIIDRRGRQVPGSQILRGATPTGYAAEPSEAVAYVDAHDNETLFDALTIKLPVGTSMADRVRMNTLCLALVALGQGPMLWHAGADLLRSKSLDRNSFDSGDWFNRIDWTGATTTFGCGLPPAADNQDKWPVHRPLLADPALAPGPEHMAAAQAAALDLLRIRFSSGLFRLGTAERIRRQLSFPAGGPDQVPGVLEMQLSGAGERIVVIFNASPWWQTSGIAEGADLTLHPVQRIGLDPVVRLTRVSSDSVTVPPRTVAVLQIGVG